MRRSDGARDIGVKLMGRDIGVAEVVEAHTARGWTAATLT